MPIPTVLTRFLPTIAAAVVALATTGTAPARAGTYDVRSCSAEPATTPPRAVTGADDAWQLETNDPTHLAGIRQCPPADDAGIDGLVAQDKFDTAGANLGRFAHWHFEAPAGTS